MKIYAAIDLKSFFASVECVLRGLNPLTTNLVVADESRTDKTICLAVSPSLKAYGISGRARLFEVKQRLAEIKRQTGKKIEFTIAVPQMAKYIEYSTKVYEVYLKFISHEDIHSYSIDECFLDLTNYINLYKMSARELVRKIIRTILDDTGITATGGIGTNLYLCKIAMDIMAKHTVPDAYGVRIAELDEMSYRQKLWSLRPLTSFWQIGRGIAAKLEHCNLNRGHGIYTMGELARVGIQNPDALYKIFGINAEILIDHAWGYEPCTIADIKCYKPKTNSLGSGQILNRAYSKEKAKIVVKEMVAMQSLELVEKRLVTNALTLFVNYDRENVDKGIYHGETIHDYYGRTLPKPAHGIANLGRYTSSEKTIFKAVTELYDRIVDPTLTIKQLNLTANNVLNEAYEEADLFTDPQKRELEKKLQQAQVLIKKRFGKNAIYRGLDFEKDATTIERNEQIGGHKA